ncbi:E3 ubiquitin-protein ligase Midline-1-like [Diadema antillarum]|uniref:E3 ubiquitin-protein ligase Midline-1-like n=1 Tax=Diadema antillarum TaxID=105358 RepID=UPI003A8637B4
MATFHEISSQELECPICLTLFNQPKSLTCSHTFCKDCLERIFLTQPNQQTITCPVCRKGTSVPSGDVRELQTNERLSSLADEVKIKNPTCTNCGIDQESSTVSYCQDCGKYMCKSCEINHFGWKPLSNHEVVPIGDVLSGKVPLRRRGKCKKHPNAEADCFCTNCREYFCITCGTVDHMQKGHLLEKVAVHEENLMTNIEELQKKAKSKKTTIGNHIDNIQTQRNEITTILKNLNDDIDKTYEEYVNLLSARREALKCQVQRLSEKLEKELKVMEEESHQTISHMNKMEELVANGMKVPLEKDALIAHDTLCENLKSFLGRDDPDDQSLRGVTERAQKISFLRHIKVNELSLGELKRWDIKADVELPVKSSMGCMTRTPDGKMAVGSWKGGIHLYSPDGELQQTVLKDVRVANLGFLSDGRSVVRDKDNKMSLYTRQWEKLDVTLETTSEDEGLYGGLTVDRDDNIYVSYWESKKIQVFTPQGGKAVREIMCDGYEPELLFSFHTTEKLILTDTLAVACLDGKGKKENVLMKEGMFVYPAVCRDDSVIVAWVKHRKGIVSIDRYTRDLDHVHNLITDFKILKPEINWYYLKEFESGEIAFCTPDRLYIFDVKCEV